MNTADKIACVIVNNAKLWLFTRLFNIVLIQQFGCSLRFINKDNIYSARHE